MKKYTIQDVYNILKKTDCTVTCFPYETAGVKFDDPVYEYDDNSYPWDDRLHDWLAQFAGVKPDNKVVYAIVPRYGTPLYVQFWDLRTTISDQMFIRRPDDLVWGMRSQMMDHIKRIMDVTGFSIDEMKMICDEAVFNLKRRN